MCFKTLFCSSLLQYDQKCTIKFHKPYRSASRNVEIAFVYKYKIHLCAYLMGFSGKDLKYCFHNLSLFIVNLTIKLYVGH